MSLTTGELLDRTDVSQASLDDTARRFADGPSRRPDDRSQLADPGVGN